MSDKMIALTEEDLARYRIQEDIPRYIEQSREALGLPRNRMRVLDLGCGRGEAVIRLRERGYDAYGVDIDSRYIENGRSLLQQRGWDPAVLTRIDAGRIGFPDAHFHFIFTDQVLEHVEDLPAAVAEMARLSAAGAGGFHSFPARRHPIEDHIRMPFVHYLPKNGLRRALILACVALGCEPRWDHLAGMGVAERARQYYEYSVGQTFYRPHLAVKRCFEDHGFRGAFVTIHKSSWRRLPLAGLVARARGGLSAIEWALLNFRSVDILTQRI
ncbi:MAG TPA: class I SAM-dependent methyltransferase [Candidatus Binatia bacterium]|nr:class I SAM-dependent methyltransferase [Candidatus Binatia bacterium]